MSKKWVLKVTDQSFSPALAEKFNLPPVISYLLALRGIVSEDETHMFLCPQLTALHDPFALKDMDKAVERVKEACAKSQKVMVYGDYDVDGITSTAVIWRCLKKLGMEVVNYIPHRMDEGYGLNLEIVPIIKDLNVSLLITVDCGITAFKEIEALQKEGVDVIVLDHHEPEEGKGVPSGFAIVDPKQVDCNYPCSFLAGVGLASKFVQALTGVYPEEDLDLVALGTIADVVPLIGENRIFVKCGLPVITQTQKEGIKALLSSARVQDKEATPRTVGFVLGPRLNAAGRMGSASTALDLLLCEDKEGAQSLVSILEAYNKERQRLQASVVDEAMKIILDQEAKGELPKVLVVYGENWHKGVVGIAASRLTERFGRPAVVISIEDGLGTGSGRSVEGFALNEAFFSCRDVLEEFGGHERAAGVRVKTENLEVFKNGLNAFAEEISLEDLVPTLEIDMELSLNQLSIGLINNLAYLEPYGEGNPAPLFCVNNVEIKGKPQASGRGTLKFWVTDGTRSFSAVGFGMAEEFHYLKAGDKVDLAYQLGIDDWNKDPQVQLILKDIK